MIMNRDRRETARKLRILRYADEIGDIAKTCRNFGVGRISFYRWFAAFREPDQTGSDRTASIDFGPHTRVCPSNQLNPILISNYPDF
jgi:hypothetical protein